MSTVGEAKCDEVSLCKNKLADELQLIRKKFGEGVVWL